jgi:hypothetical protein
LAPRDKTNNGIDLGWNKMDQCEIRMNESRRAQLSANMLACSYIVKKLLMRIAEVENDTETPLEDKVSQIKKIKDEITKVGTEIDSIKKEITLLNAYNVN